MSKCQHLNSPAGRRTETFKVCNSLLQAISVTIFFKPRNSFKSFKLKQTSHHSSHFVNQKQLQKQKIILFSQKLLKSKKQCHPALQTLYVHINDIILIEGNFRRTQFLKTSTLLWHYKEALLLLPISFQERKAFDDRRYVTCLQWRVYHFLAMEDLGALNVSHKEAHIHKSLPNSFLVCLGFWNILKINHTRDLC